MSQPLSSTLAHKIIKYKNEHNLSYHQLAEMVGVTGALISSRVAHCVDNSLKREPLTLSDNVTEKLKELVNSQTPPKVKMKKAVKDKSVKKEGHFTLASVDTGNLIAELKRRGASTITF